MIQFIIWVVLSILTTVRADDRHKIVYKSLQQATNECTQYNVQGGCLPRCVTLTTRDWNDTLGISSVYSRFFHPDPNDICSNNRTQRCLNSKITTIPQQNSCLRASESVQCYLDQYGQVNTTIPQFIRFTILQDAQLFYECAAILGYSHQLDTLLNDWEFKRQETRCVLRCFMIRSGLYSEPKGLNMARYYVLCGGYEDGFYQQAAECASRLRQEVPCEDKCTLAQRMATECIGVDYATSSIMQNQGDSANYVLASRASSVYMVNDQNADSDATYRVVNSGSTANIVDNGSSSTYQGGNSNMFFRTSSNRR
uniref:Putative cpij008161 odorant-binding protein n=1 Tax=Aedes albopictus TaxID=7160 RepID=A0A023EPA2_AEDAL